MDGDVAGIADSRIARMIDFLETGCRNFLQDSVVWPELTRVVFGALVVELLLF